jgi:hypothetical protein
MASGFEVELKPFQRQKHYKISDGRSLKGRKKETWQSSKSSKSRQRRGPVTPKERFIRRSALCQSMKQEEGK